MATQENQVPVQATVRGIQVTIQGNEVLVQVDQVRYQLSKVTIQGSQITVRGSQVPEQANQITTSRRRLEFMDLPAEIRLMIYEHIISKFQSLLQACPWSELNVETQAPSAQRHVLRKSKRPQGVPRMFKVNTVPSTGLLYVCRRINAEVRCVQNDFLARIGLPRELRFSGMHLLEFSKKCDEMLRCDNDSTLQSNPALHATLQWSQNFHRKKKTDPNFVFAPSMLNKFENMHPVDGQSKFFHVQTRIPLPPKAMIVFRYSIGPSKANNELFQFELHPIDQDLKQMDITLMDSMDRGIARMSIPHHLAPIPLNSFRKCHCCNVRHIVPTFRAFSPSKTGSALEMQKTRMDGLVLPGSFEHFTCVKKQVPFICNHNYDPEIHG